MPDPMVILAESARLSSALLSSLLGGGAALGSSRPSADISEDVGVFCVYTIVCFVFQWGVRLALIAPLASSLLTNPGTSIAPSHDNLKVSKFAQSAMEAVTYGGFMLIGLLVVSQQPYAWPSSLWWDGFTAAGAPHALMRDDVRCFYILYSARYAQGAVSVLLEPKRKDFVEMMIHHIVTVVLIGLSYRCGWNRVGVIVMVILDPADVPLHLAKLCKYVSEAKDGSAAANWQFAADRLFEIFAVVFFVMRLVLYPYVCWSAHVESKAYFSHGTNEWACVLLLEVLLVLQVYWFSLIIKVAIKMAKGASVEDVRSDDEDDEGEEEAAKDK